MSTDDAIKRLTVLIVYDGKRGPTATQAISFGQPFEAGGAGTEPRIIFQQHLADIAAIEAAFSKHQPNLLILSRYTSDKGQEWIRLARNAKIPVIFHIDDDLLAVPESLGEAKYKAYNNPERLLALRQNIDCSDLLYVSTSELTRRFEDHGVATPIVAGRIYCSVACEEVGALLAPAAGPVIGYMGTSGHSADLAMITPALCDLMDAVPGLQFETFGTVEMPAAMERFGSRVRHIAPVADYRGFLAELRTLGWWIGLAPLEDNQFNRCKADTKWVEYSTAGIAVVASDLPVYHRACDGEAGMLADSNEAWTRALLKLIYRPHLRYQMVDRAQTKLRSEYTHGCLRQQVLDVFDLAVAVSSDRGSVN